MNHLRSVCGILLAGLLAHGPAPAVTPTGKTPFTIADLYRVKNVSDPQWSPDGKRIAFVLTEYDLPEGKSNAEIYIVNADGSGLRRMTNNPASDNHPRWSPDGRSILFLSGRADGTQAWILPADGGEPHRLTAFSFRVGSPLWLPDGSGFLFTADVFPECGASDSCNGAIAARVKDGPVQAYVADRLLYRHWASWSGGRRKHILRFDIAAERLRDLTPGDFDSPSWGAAEDGFDVSPDGREICFTSNRTLHEAENTNKDLWIAPAGGGEARNITAGNEAFDGDPRYSPDGSRIAFRLQTVPVYEADRFRLAVYDRASGTVSVLTESFDYWVNEFLWSPDGKEIFFTSDARGHVPLFAVDVKSKKVRPVTDLKTIDDFSVAPDGRTVAVTRRSVGEPSELWRAGTGGAGARALTSFNADLAKEVDIRPAEEMWITSPTGRAIHTFIVKPHGFDRSKKYPLILNVHGGPQGHWADAFRGDWQVYPGAGYVVAFPNPHGSTGYGQEFTLAISKDWAGKVYEDVMAVTDSLSRLPWIDADRMGAMGWSYGGYMMMWMEGHTRRFKALAAMMGVYNLKAMHGATEELWFPEYDLGGTPWESDLYEKWSPNRFVENYSTPCLVITGQLDFRVPYTQSLEFFTDLQRKRVPSRLIVFKNDGHWPGHVKSMPLYYNAHLEWFHRYLGGAPAPYGTVKLSRNQVFDTD